MRQPLPTTAPFQAARVPSAKFSEILWKPVVFREPDFVSGSKCCWFFLNVTKNFRVKWLLKAPMPFRHFPLPFESGCYNLRLHEPGSTLFQPCPTLGDLSASPGPIHL